MMLPVGRIVLLRTIPKARFVGAMAWVTIPALVGPVIGPPIGGLIVTYLSWRWIFDINVPIGILGIVLVSLFIADSRDPAPGKLDLSGLLLSGLALGGLMGVLELAGRHLVPAYVIAAIGAAGVLSAAAYGWHARAQTRPLLDFSLFRLPTFAVAVIAAAPCSGSASAHSRSFCP